MVQKYYSFTSGDTNKPKNTETHIDMFSLAIDILLI